MKNKAVLFVVVLIAIAFVLVSCDNSDKNAGKEDGEIISQKASSQKLEANEDAEPETTNPPGYHSLNISVGADWIYGTEPYSSFIPSKEAMEAAGFVNASGYLLGEPESEKPWTCLNTCWKKGSKEFRVTVMHINCPYGYGANSSDNTPQSFTFDAFEESLAPNNSRRSVTVKVGDYVATYVCNRETDITAEELYALITSAPCFNNAE